MRVQNPDQYAATLLNITMPNERYTPEKIRSMYGRSEIDLKFPTPIPVNITYQTAFVDDAGKLQIRKDIYGRDAAMIGLLKNSRSKDLETMVAHAQPNYSRPSEARACRPASTSPATTPIPPARRSSSACSAARRPRRRRPRSAAGRSSGSPGNPEDYCLRAEFPNKINDLVPPGEIRLR